jgi:TonB family protein
MLARTSKGRPWVRGGGAAQALIVLVCSLLWSVAQAADPPAVEPPKIVHFVEAEFPESERDRGEDVAVLLRVAITETGAVAAVAVVESAGQAFDDAAVAAMQQARFEPARIDGNPAPVQIDYRYRFVWREEIVEATTAELVGTVRERGSERPLADVEVRLDDGRSVRTDKRGRFHFENIEPGERTVSVSGEELTPVGAHETLTAGERLEVLYEVEYVAEDDDDDDDADIEFEFVVTAPRIKRQVVSTEVVAAESRKVPGTQGDVLKVIENLPGVARASAGSASLVVWGAAPEDTRVYVDGLRIPRLYHDGGYRSVLHSDMVRSVELIPGGYGPGFGRGLGGMVNIRQTALDEDGVHGSVALDVIDVQASLRAKLGKKFRLSGAFRRSHLDGVMPLVAGEGVGDIIPIPRYYDGQARLGYEIDEQKTVEVGALLSSDRIRRTVVASDPTLTSRDSRAMAFHRVYARYDKVSEDEGNTSALLYYGQNASTIDNRFAGVETFVRHDAHIIGGRLSWRTKLARFLAAEAGIDGDFTLSDLQRSGSLGAPPREGDARVFGQPPSGQLNADSWDTVQGSIAAFAALDFGLFDDKLHIIPGFRVEPYVSVVSRALPRVGENPVAGKQRLDMAYEPRLSTLYQITKRLSAKAAFGIYHQQPLPEDLSAVFGRPDLGLSRALHYLAGAGVQITEHLDVEVTGFYSDSKDLVWRNIAPQPFIAQALSQVGRGRAYGGQILVRQQQVGRFFGWLSYSMMRSERRDDPSLPWRLFDFDQTHVLTAVASVDLGAGFDVGGRTRFATGYPRTPVLGAYYDGTTDRYEPLFGERNTIRIPPFFSADLRISKVFRFKKREEGSIELYLEVQNITNRRNPEELVFDPTYTQSDYIYGFPTLPVFGVKGTW